MRVSTRSLKNNPMKPKTSAITVSPRFSLRLAPALVVAALILCCPLLTRANTITIFNTGVDNSNNLLPAMSVDPHYQLNGGPAFVGANPISTWIPNGPNSQWITPTPDASQGFFGSSTPYVYTTTFTLPVGFSGATLSGQWATDNSAFMSLNGGPAVSTTPDVGYTAFTPFSITSGFMAGINTITFDVFNSGAFVDMNPTGLRVEISGSFTPAAGVADSGSTFGLLFAGWPNK
jgi:hypothetical protein